MPPKIYHRDISPFLQNIRAFLLGRWHTNALRFEDGIAARTQPPPCIPDGPAHKFSANYYCGRDARREALPPINLTQKAISDGATPRTKLPQPGVTFNWDKH